MNTKRLRFFHKGLGTAVLAMLIALSLFKTALAEGAPSPGAEEAVLVWLRARLGSPTPTRYLIGWQDLNGDGLPEAIVYITGRDWCGSGGCHMYILQLHGRGILKRASTTVTQLPISVLNTRTHGWRDVAVGVCGGGATRCYRAKLQFDGHKYMSNPSLAYALIDHPPARVVIQSDGDSRPLYGDALTGPSGPDGR